MPEKALEWPQPPNEPRIRFVRSWTGSADFKKKVSVKDILLGREDAAAIGLNKPYGVAADSKGRVYVCDTIQSKVVVLDPVKQEARFLGAAGQGMLACERAANDRSVRR